MATINVGLLHTGEEGGGGGGGLEGWVGEGGDNDTYMLSVKAPRDIDYFLKREGAIVVVSESESSAPANFSSFPLCRPSRNETTLL